MLILTRRVNENIRIGDDITVTILGIQDNHVRIGINAPREVEIHREEIYKKIQRERGLLLSKDSPPQEEASLTSPRKGKGKRPRSVVYEDRFPITKGGVR